MPLLRPQPTLGAAVWTMLLQQLTVPAASCLSILLKDSFDAMFLAISAALLANAESGVLRLLRCVSGYASMHRLRSLTLSACDQFQ